jgi:Ca-activated chloride channel family protein
MYGLLVRLRGTASWFCVLLAFACGLPPQLARAQQAGVGGAVPMKLQEVQSGTLLIKSADDGGTLAAPRQATEVNLRVSGMVVRATVKQTFHNPGEDWVEGIYVFPLPENAAVDHMKMRIGERVVEGEIQEQAAAKKVYEQAKSSGRRAALLEQERPNLFTSSVANIGPRDTIVIELEYQQTLRYDNGQFSLRFPTAITPRYIPGAVKVAGVAGSGWSANTNVVTDAARITPPVPLTGSLDAPLNPLALTVELDAGVPIAALESPYHPLDVREIDAQRRAIRLEGQQWATRDFELTWKPLANRQPQAAFFTETRAEKTYGLLMVMPPAASTMKVMPREVIYIIDTSGSMSGVSIMQAKQALQLAVQRLNPGDTFNVIEFNSYAKALFDGAQPVTPLNVDSAVRWVQGLRAQGGTEMALALNLALNGGENPERVRQVIFLTDGAVGNEDQLFKLISDRLGDSRLFTVGIGSAPNSHFMNKAAQAGRGTFTYIGKVEEVQEKMSALFAKLESPVLKGVQVSWPRVPGGAKVEAWPQRVPDLYLGEPIVISAALTGAQGDIQLSGMQGDLPWKASLPLSAASRGQGMGVLWAREKIGALIDTQRDGRPEEEVRPAVVQVALEHHLVSKYTSLIAVDKTPVRPTGEWLNTAALPGNLPDGQVHAAIFGGQQADLQGELPQGATDARLNLLLGMLLLTLAAGLRHVRRGARA